MNKKLILAIVGLAIAFGGCAKYPDPITKKDADKFYAESAQKDRDAARRHALQIQHLKETRAEYKREQRDYADTYR